MAKCEIITIGDELLIGQVVNTNMSWIASELSHIGMDITRAVTISDDKESILEALKVSHTRNDVVIITGGLGPTNDDITKECACEFFNTTLTLNEQAYQNIVERFSMLGYEVTRVNMMQAMVPSSCIPLQNKCGTAPGMLFERIDSNGNPKLTIFLPGVPKEMKHLMDLYVKPLIKSTYNQKGIYYRTVLTQGRGESFVAEEIKDWEANLPSNVKVAYIPQYGNLKLRVTAYGRDREENMQIVEEEIGKLTELIPDIVYGYDEDTLELVLGIMLLSNDLTISTAESCSGGAIASRITSIPNSSQYFKGSLVAYTNEVKVDVLGVKQSTIDNYGAVSKETVEEMAKQSLELMGTDIAIATTGMAGPTSSDEQIPIGTIWIAVASHDSVESKMFCFGDDREINIKRTANSALKMAYDYLITNYL